MALELTTKALAELQKTSLTPNLVLEIEGVPTLYGNIEILEFVKIGPELVIGEFIIGGSSPIDGQEALISLKNGTTTQIRQTLKQDKGVGDTVSSMRIALVDKDGLISKLITPGNVITDVLGTRAKLWWGLDSTNWRDDYIVLFRGVIDTIESAPGIINLNIASPSQKTRSSIFTKVDTELTVAMAPGDLVADVDATLDFLDVYTGANGLVDDSLKLYLRINDEIMRYESIDSSTRFGTLTRGQLGTVAANHGIGDGIESFYRLEGNNLELALKIMLSGSSNPYLDEQAVTNFVRTSPTELIPNSIFFNGEDLKQLHNVQIGDFITTTGASNGANNVTNKAIAGIVKTITGSYIIVDGVTFIEENGSAALLSIRSKYQTLSDGLELINDEVDIDQFISIKSIFLNDFDMDIYLTDSMEDAKEWMGLNLFLPAGAFSLPRKARISVGIHQGPLPGINIKTLNTDSVSNPSSLKVTRSINKNFYNTVIHRYEEDALEPEKFYRHRIEYSQLSRDQIDYPSKVLEILFKGGRQILSADNIAQQAQDRILRKYKFAAESVKGVKVNLKTGLDIEIGDILSLDLAAMQATDIKNDGTRDGALRLFEVENKTFALDGKETTLDLIDTNFSNDTRFATWSAASYIDKNSTAQDEIIIKASFYTDRFGVNEWAKWLPLLGAACRVRSVDYSVSGTATLIGVNGNTLTFDGPLGFLPLEDYILDLDIYDNQPDNIKLVFGFWSDGTNPFSDGLEPYQWY